MSNNHFNIFRNASISNCVTCVHDTKCGYSVSWQDNNDLNGYSTVSGITSNTTWDGIYFGVSSSSSCYISQDNDIQIDASIYNLLKVTFRLDMGHHVVGIPITGRITFKTTSDSSWPSENYVDFSINPDNAYREYTVDMSTVTEWSGIIDRFRVYPFIDGVSGIKIHIKSIKVESRNTYACGSVYTGSICNRYNEYSHPCPWIGSAGKYVSSSLPSRITIEESVNDSFLLNVGGFGDQKITLRPLISGSLDDIAFDIQDKINTIGIGGYSVAKCYTTSSNQFIIEADYFGTDSTVVVSPTSSGSAYTTLGFTNGISYTGSESASEYITESFEIDGSITAAIRGSNKISDCGMITMDGKSYSVQGGNSNYDKFVKDNKITFRNQTFVDYNNPITQNGLIKKIFYSGDVFSNTVFRVYRQRVDGTFILVHSVDISATPEKTDIIFEKSVNLRVRKGDLLGIYSGAIHSGYSFEKGNYTYVLYDGDLITGTPAQKLYGTGESGLPIYARGDFKKNKAVIDFVFDSVLPLEEVFIRADEDIVDEDINICTLRNGGIGGGPHITAYTGLDSTGVQAPDIENIDALVDGLKQNINGESPECYPGWLDLSVAEQEKYYYTDFYFKMDFAKGIDVLFDIYKLKMYFSDDKNIKFFGFKVPISFSSTDLVQVWDYGWDSYDSVVTDIGVMDENTIYLYNNPAVVTADDYQVAYSHLEYKYLELSLADPYSTRSLMYDVSFAGRRNTDIYDNNYSYFPFAPSPRIQEIEVFCKSTPNKNIVNNFKVESSYDGSTYLSHTDINEYGNNSIGFTIGRPSRYLRITIEAENTLTLKNLECSLSESLIKLFTNGEDGVILNTPKDNPLDVYEIIVKNSSTDTSNFYIDIFSDSSKSNRCILFNKLSNDNELEQSTIGPGGIVRKRDSIQLRPYNYAYKCPSYYLDRNFIFGNKSYVSYNNKVSWSCIGSLVTDGSDSSYITNEFDLFHLYRTMYVCVDLGDNYAVDNVELKNPEFTAPFSDIILYSCMDTDDPNNIPTSPSDPNGWLSTSKSNARWVLLQAPSAKPGGTGVRYLSRVLIDLDFRAALNKGKLPWTDSNDLLTNGVSEHMYGTSYDGWINTGDAYYYCVDLRWWFDISNVMVGPFPSYAVNVTNSDILVAGDNYSYVESDCTSLNVAYSKSNEDDPKYVEWGSFGAADNSKARWVLLKTTTRIDDVLVHICSNIQDDKPSFINKYWCSGGLGVYEEYADNPSGVCAIAADYPASYGPTEDYILYAQNLGIDSELAKRDAFSFWFYISDVTQLDSSSGYIQVGKSLTQDNKLTDMNITQDSYNYYRWPISIFYSSLGNGWNYLKLPFSDNYKNGSLHFTEDDKSRMGESVVRDRFTNIKLVYKGVTGNSAFTVRLSDFSILRRYYSVCKFDHGIYIPDGDYVRFSLSGFNPYMGTIEFFMKPDWSKSMVSSSANPKEHTIFRVFNTEDTSLFGLFKTSDGLRFYVTDGNTRIAVTDSSSYLVSADVPTHIAVVWDFGGLYTKNAISLIIDGRVAVTLSRQELLSYGYSLSFDRNSIYTLMLGGRGWEGLLSRYVSSADAVFENIKVYNYPIYNFDNSRSNGSEVSVRSSNELVELSLDNINFFDYHSGLLPVIKSNVTYNESFKVFVRGKDLNQTRDGQFNRQPYIYISRIKS